MQTTGTWTPSTATRRFDRFELRPSERMLLSDGTPVAIGARAFDLLVALSDRPGSLVTKDDLLGTVWRGLVVEENNLQVQISTLRKILGHTALATIPGRGYRFNLPVARSDADRAPPDPAPGARGDEDIATGRRSNLPPRLPTLYGRDGDIAAVTALVRRHAVVTITGAGGIGKTRVAQAVARQLMDETPAAFGDGIWWVELAALTDGGLVPSAVAEAMDTGIEGERPTAHALQAHLAGKRALLVLDNCEHLADAVAAMIERLTAAAPALGVLVTSQETIKASDEHVYRLGGLAVDDGTGRDTESGAMALFAARAHAADPRFALTEANRPAVAEICRRLDGIPLAIELAAARLPLLGVEGLRARLHERFNLLTGGARVVLRRHQTLRATLEWSHALLTADEQAVFRRLGVFAGGFTLEAAQSVASDDRIDPWMTLDHLGALVDKSLVLAEGDDVPRYRMLETTRAYALERLVEAGEMQSTLRRHAHAMLALLEPYERNDWSWRATGGIEVAARLELDNMRAALEWAQSARDGPLAIALAGVSYSVWWSSFHLAEGLGRCLALRRFIDDGVSKADAARFWLTIAEIGVYSIRRESYEAGVRAARLYRELGDAQRTFDALAFAAVQGTRFGTLDDMKAMIDESARIEQPDWPARQRAKLQFARCFWFARQQRYADALACAERQVAICREAGVEAAALYATSNVALMEVLVGRPRDAIEHSRAATARLATLGMDGGAGHLYFGELVAWLMLERVDEALAAARNAHPRLVREGDQHRLLLPLALAHALRGHLDTATRIAAYDRAAQARSGENPSVHGPPLEARLEAILKTGLSADARKRVDAQGAALTEDEAFRLALS
ncbi:MAG TPA: winged helix-turn-helix domain-containing protein [Casimicrobiaceae bacterium]|nr:winged helix-turn-helix domain-containing protein [Casimicrobiaceae bacterium]